MMIVVMLLFAAAMFALSVGFDISSPCFSVERDPYFWGVAPSIREAL